MRNQNRHTRCWLPLALLCASTCACESGGKSRPTVQAEAPIMDAMPITKPPEADSQPSSPPPSTQEAAILALANSIVALPPGLLATPSELSTHLTLPVGMAVGSSLSSLQPANPAKLKLEAQRDSSHHGYAKTTIFKLGTNASVTLTLTMQDGTWEAPKGNSEPRSAEPLVESIELSGPGSLGLAPPAGAQRIASTLPADTAPVMAWAGGNYLSEKLSEPSFYLGHFIGRAPFHFTEVERATLEKVIIDISKAIAKGGLNVPAYMAEKHGKRRVTETDQFGFTSSPPPGQQAAADKPLIYDFGAGRIGVGPNYISVTFVGPMKMPGFFRAFDVRMIETSFANDAGQMVRDINVSGLRIYPNNYFFGETRRYTSEDEMGLAAEAMLLSLVIQERQER